MSLDFLGHGGIVGSSLHSFRDARSECGGTRRQDPERGWAAEPLSGPSPCRIPRSGHADRIPARAGGRRAPLRASAPLPRPDAAQIRALEPAQDDLLGSSDDSFEPRFEAFGSSGDLSGERDGPDLPDAGPPKDEDEIEDLFVELVDEES